MTTHFATDLVTISTSDLCAATGGDAGSDYTDQVGKDMADTKNREDQAVDAARKRQWGTAAKRGVQAAVDNLKTESDVLKPLKDFINLGK